MEKYNFMIIKFVVDGVWFIWVFYLSRPLNTEQQIQQIQTNTNKYKQIQQIQTKFLNVVQDTYIMFIISNMYEEWGRIQIIKFTQIHV